MNAPLDAARPPLPLDAARPPLPLNVAEWADEAFDLLRDLIRIPTVNPPGDELPAIHHIEHYLRRHGLQPQVFEPVIEGRNAAQSDASTSNRANLALRLPGSGEMRPLLLSGHVDVVPVSREHWAHDPFAGEIHDGCLWGRGAIDMKHMVAMEVCAVAALHRAQAPLSRDLVLVCVADEEAGCDFGARWMTRHHPEYFDAEYALNEVGGFTYHLDGRRFYLAQTAEKGIAWLRVTARGQPGHGSVPKRDAALIRLALAAHRLGTHALPLHATPPARRFLDEMAARIGGIKGLVLRSLSHPLCGPLLREHLLPDEAQKRNFQALLCNTANPTRLNAGVKINVIPDQAVLEIDGRVLPGQTTDGFIREVKALIGEGFDLEVLREHPGTQSPADDAMLALFQRLIDRHDGGARVIPYLTSGFTDSAFYRPLGIKSYGFSPVRFPPQLSFQELFHGHNERIPVDGFRWGFGVFLELVAELCGVRDLLSFH